MVWIFFIFRPRIPNNEPQIKHPPLKKSHPWVLSTMCMSQILSLFLLTVVFLPGWDTNGDTLYYFPGNLIAGSAWTTVPLILLCCSIVFSIILFVKYISVHALIHTGYNTKIYGFTPPMRKSAFWFLFWIILQIILIFSALLTFTIGLANFFIGNCQNFEKIYSKICIRRALRMYLGKIEWASPSNTGFMVSNTGFTLGYGYCFYITCGILGLYVIAGITWFIFVWKYFHEYEIDSATGKCKNCS